MRFGIGTDVGAGTSFSMLATLGEAYKVGQLRAATASIRSARCIWPPRAARRARTRPIGSAGCKPGQEADFVVLDCAATPLLARRTAGAGLAERLFALQILGDDRAIARTYLMGVCAWTR